MRSNAASRQTGPSTSIRLYKCIKIQIFPFDNPPIFNNIEPDKDGMIRAVYVVEVIQKTPDSRESIGVPAKLRSRFVG